MINENCTVYLPDETVRARITRAIKPDVLSHVVVDFPAEMAKHLIDPDSVQLDNSVRFSAEIPTNKISPDASVESINWYYYIGDALDACPCSIDNWEWYNEEQS